MKYELFTVKQLKKLGTEEQLFAALLGEIAERLDYPSGDMPFYRKKERFILAGKLLEDFIESGDVTLRKESKTVDGQLKTFNKVTIVGGKKKKEKDLNRGFEGVAGKVLCKAVGNVRLRSDDKAALRLLSSTKMYRSSHCGEAFLKKAHSLIHANHASKKGKDKRESVKELPWKRLARYEEIRETALKHQDFYLSAKPDGRGRMYYEGSRLDGFRPQGKSYESASFELSSRTLTSSGRKVLERLKPADIALSEVTTEEELFDYLRGKQIASALHSNSTGMTIEADVTNSGLLIAGLSFKSPEMLKATNGYGSKVRADSHSVFGKAVGLPRADAKGLHTQLLHGASFKTIAKSLTEITGKAYSVGEVTELLEKAYGKAVHNIYAIADYGRRVVNNARSEVSWIMPDEFRATHRAYTTHVPLELQLKKRKVKVVSPMPLLLDGKGFPVYDNKTVNKDKDSTISTKMMGLYANIIHSIDAYVMREVIKFGIPLLAKHDAFLIHPNDVDKLVSTLQRIYSEVCSFDIIRNILEDIEDSTGVIAPELFIGDAANRMYKSELFITVE